MAISNPLHGVRKGGTVGKPLPRVEVKILAEDGSEVVTRGVGELCVRSPSLFKEYWKLPKLKLVFCFLIQNKAVSECCVLGLLDEDYGEIIPTKLFLWDSLPRNAMGKREREVMLVLSPLGMTNSNLGYETRAGTKLLQPMGE
ncbi:hypothetical protein BHM03_00000935 [Ensete ventricosum]|uniref:AMP-dependent synthetase/ligase domain-containing protein n=1 Tax=Ensete ventricosum TaxID=4639 RepID=A0A445M8R9_ENSVE|nr:hypothetical protein BHM03_00000935 [Ensete ventricosum]